jgi:hypothetical protein
MVKIRNIDNKETEKFLNEMSDKQYGVDERVERVTISMRGNLFDKLDNEVRHRKRSKKCNRTMSALIVEAVEYYLNSQLNNPNS